MLRVMKKVLVNIISILSLTLVIVSSCTKENQEQNGNILGSRKITATFDDNTKTELGLGNKPEWSEGDKIWVSDGTNSASITLTASDIKTATTFEITLPKSITGSTIYAVYPAAVASGITGEEISISIPQTQTGTFAEANICVAKTNGNNLKFKNATSIIKVSDFQGYITSVEFNIKNGAGEYFITYGDGLAIRAGATSNKITLSPNNNNHGPYYIAVAPVSIAAKSEFNYKNDTFNSYVGKYVVTTEKELKNNTIYNIGSFKANKLPGVFTVSAEGKKIQFSTGYLQAIYNASTDSYNWQNASNQLKVVSGTTEDGNLSVNSQGDGKIVDCFESITPTNSNGLGFSGSSKSEDWGALLTDDTWSSLDEGEWGYLINTRGIQCATATIGIGEVGIDNNGISGVLIFPDEFHSPAGIPIIKLGTECSFNNNTFTCSQFEELEKNGAVFLAKGDCTNLGRYKDNNYAFQGVFVKIKNVGTTYIYKGIDNSGFRLMGGSGGYGMAVRLTTVYNAPSSSSVSANTIDLGLNEINNEWN